MRIHLWIVLVFLILFSVAVRAATQEHADATSTSQIITSTTIKSSDPVVQDHASNPVQPEVENTLSHKLPSDVRILIDVSGSMKKTDPQNLRRPALDLILRLIPDKSRAGLWFFGNDVNMIMPHRIVDDDWRKQAALKAEKINSIALYTNIGKALDVVSYDEKNLSPAYKTHIILLTDGVVDVSSEAVENIKERQRILGAVLAKLKNAGYIIHTIALSADADADLLKKISVATDGVSVIANSADELTSTFLKIFDEAVPAERVPLENNRFLVDASVKEFTALIFRKPGVEKSIIQDPDGTEYSATNPRDGINWYRTDKYDLITASSPRTGQWIIKTDITSQSRITVISNLQLIMQPLKNNIHSNDNLILRYSFQENGKTVTNTDFLTLLETSVIIVKNGSKENTSLALEMPIPPPADGIYQQHLNTFAEVGDYEIHVFVDGKTFKREFKHSLSVRDSLLTVTVSDGIDEKGNRIYSYKIIADEKFVNLGKTKMTVVVKDSNNKHTDQELQLIDNNRWEFSFTPEQATEYNLGFHALGEMVDGDTFDEKVNAKKIIHEKKVIEETAKSAAPKKVETPVVEEKPAIATSAGSNTVLYVAIAVANLFIAVLGFFAYRMFFGSNVKDELAELEKTLTIEVEQAKEKAAGKPTGKLKISLNEQAAIPMNDSLGMDTLFPLDDLEDKK